MIQQDIKAGYLAEALALSKMSVNARLNGRTPCRQLELEKLAEILKSPVEAFTIPDAPKI